MIALLKKLFKKKPKPHRKAGPKQWDGSDPLPGDVVYIDRPIDISGWHGTEDQPIELHLEIEGGDNNAKFTDCFWLKLIAPMLSNPTGKPDPDRHNLQFADDCHNIVVIGGECTCETPSADGISFYLAHDIEVIGTLVSGPRINDDTDQATDVCIDRGSHNIILTRLRLPSKNMVKIGIAAGTGHRVRGCKALRATSACVQIENEYKVHATGKWEAPISDIEITGNIFSMVKGNDSPHIYVQEGIQGVVDEDNKLLYT